MGRRSRRSQSLSTRHCGGRRLIGVHAAGPRAPRNAVLPPVCVPTETGIYNQFIRRSKGGVGDAHWGNPEYATAIVHKITLFKLKILIILNHCDLMFFQYANIMRIFQK